MGYKKSSTKTKKIEENRDYIIGQLLGLDGDPVSALELSNEMSCDESYLNKHISRWRKAGFIGYIKQQPLEDDRDIITTLYVDGMTIRDLSRKWECASSSMFKALERWGVRRDGYHAGDPMGKISLDELKKTWAEIKDPVIVTVGRVPKFYLAPINKEEE